MKLRTRNQGKFILNKKMRNGNRFCKLGDEAPVPEDGIKPTFTERPVIRQSDDGNTITFECRLAGDPKPSVTW